MRATRDVPKLNIMQISLRSCIVFTTVLMTLSACTRKQPPSPIDTLMGSGTAIGQDDLIITGDLGDYGLGADGLELRDDQNNIENGYYNGREMIVGKLPSIYFGFDSASIPATERIKLQEAANYLANNPSENLLIEGRSDWYGTADYNIALSDRRANSALDYLNTLGADSSRIETLSKGSLEATSGLSKTQASQDRRADLILLK